MGYDLSSVTSLAKIGRLGVVKETASDNQTDIQTLRNFIYRCFNDDIDYKYGF